MTKYNRVYSDATETAMRFDTFVAHAEDVAEVSACKAGVVGRDHPVTVQMCKKEESVVDRRIATDHNHNLFPKQPPL